MSAKPTSGQRPEAIAQTIHQRSIRLTDQSRRFLTAFAERLTRAVEYVVGICFFHCGIFREVLLQNPDPIAICNVNEPPRVIPANGRNSSKLAADFRMLRVGEIHNFERLRRTGRRGSGRIGIDERRRARDRKETFGATARGWGVSYVRQYGGLAGPGNVDKCDIGASLVLDIEIIAAIVLGTQEPRNRNAGRRNMADNFDGILGRTRYYFRLLVPRKSGGRAEKHAERKYRTHPLTLFLHLIAVPLPASALVSVLFLAPNPTNYALRLSEVFLTDTSMVLFTESIQAFTEAIVVFQ
jgi:hypothetical protein